MACTKGTIIERTADQQGIDEGEAADKVETLIEIIKATLASGDNVMVSGFGKFEVKEKAKRKGRNPASGKAMILPPRRVVTFKCAGKLREKINWG